eukprot:scaffold45645_cov17-Tisochrysis_lutea.AAC.1
MPIIPAKAKRAKGTEPYTSSGGKAYQESALLEVLKKQACSKIGDSSAWVHRIFSCILRCSSKPGSHTEQLSTSGGLWRQIETLAGDKRLGVVKNLMIKSLLCLWV